MGINLAKLLVREDLVSIEQIREALERQREMDYGLGESLVDLGYMSESQLVDLLGTKYGVPVMNIDNLDVDLNALDLVPKETALDKCIIPLSVTGSDLTIAMSDPSDILLIDDLGFLTGKNIRPVVASERSIKVKISEFYGEEGCGDDSRADNSMEPPHVDKTNASSSSKKKHDRSVDQIIKELEQYRKAQLSPADPSSEEEMPRESEIESDVDDKWSDLFSPPDSSGGTESIESEDYEFDLDIYDEDEDGDSPALQESMVELIGDSGSVEEDDVTEGAFDIDLLPVESQGVEELFAISPIVREGEDADNNEELNSEIAAESDEYEENPIIQTAWLPDSESGENSERVIGFTPAFEAEENTAEDIREQEGIEEVELAQEQEAGNDNPMPGSDEVLQSDDSGHTGDVLSKRNESAESPFSAPREDEYALEDEGDFPSLDNRQEPAEFVSGGETEQDPSEFSSMEHGSVQADEAPDSSHTEEERESFSSDPVFSSSIDEELGDVEAHLESKEAVEEAHDGLTGNETSDSGPLDLTSSIFGVGEADELNGRESSSEDHQGFSAPAVDTSGGPEEAALDTTPPPESELFVSAEESRVEGEEKGPGPENSALFDTGAERPEEEEKAEDLPVSMEESPDSSLFSAPTEEPPEVSPENTREAGSSVDKTDFEPPKESSEEADLLNSPEIIQRDTNGSGEKGSVLVVDGSPTVRKIVSVTLERQGYRVYTAADSMQALAKLNEVTPDLIFVDVKLPHMDGYQLCKVIKSHGLTKNIPVVMMTGKAGMLDKMKWKRAGARHYITKPFDPKLLVETAIKYSS